MIWTQATVFTTSEGIDTVAGILLLNGINGYSTKDSRDFAEFLSDKEILWDYIEDDVMDLLHCETTVTFYLTDDEQGRTRYSEILAALERVKREDTERKFGRLCVVTSPVADEDWENNWKKHFKPINIGKNVIVKPTWEKLEEKEAAGKTVIEIDPASSFGTGSHTTTKLCLESVEKMFSDFSRDVPEMLDVGCGSGIIGILAHKLGAGHVTAIDIEENCIRIANENFGVNKVPQDAYDAYVGDIINDTELFGKIAKKEYRVIAANIVSDVLKAMAPLFYRLLSDDGRIVISGIIAERAREVEEKFLDEGFFKLSETERDEWAAIVFGKGA